MRLIALLVLLPSLAFAQGGPDAYGYSWMPVAYDFVPIAGIGDEHVFTAPDDYRGTITPPWEVSIYGYSTGFIKVGADGDIGVTTFHQYNANNCDPGLSGASISVFWDDLAPENGGGVWSWYDATNDRIIISWEDVPRAPNWGAASFQAHFYPDGRIQMHWADTFFGHGQYDHGASATIGIDAHYTPTPQPDNTLIIGCDTPLTLEGTAVEFAICPDADGDGYLDATCFGEDCLDSDATVNPEGVEVCNGLDDDCDAATDEDIDGDGDGETICGGDCDDTNPAFFAANPEVCDAIDQDCDGDVDEDFDTDLDGTPTCGPDGVAGNEDDDCDDTDPVIYPTAPELCDGIDNTCVDIDSFYEWPATNGTNSHSWGNGGSYQWQWRIQVEETILLDTLGYEMSLPGGTEMTWSLYEQYNNGNSFHYVESVVGQAVGGGLVLQESPPLGWSLPPGDWGLMLHTPRVDLDYAQHINMPNPDPTPWGFFVAGDTLQQNNPQPVASIGLIVSGSNPSHPLQITTGQEDDTDGDGTLDCADCADDDAASFPGASEVCDGDDNDCDGFTLPDEADEDGDGSFLCDAVPDCDDTSELAYPGAPEACNEADDDCDGVIPSTEWDLDFDGWISCADCDDNDELQHPDATEICDGEDTNCDGSLGEDSTWSCTNNNASYQYTDRYAGAGFVVTNTEMVAEFEVYLDWLGGDLQWGLYRKQDTSTLYDRLWHATTTPAAGTGWETSPPVNVQMEAGYTYALLIGWDVGMDDMQSCFQSYWPTIPWASWRGPRGGSGGDLENLPTLEVSSGHGPKFRVHIQGEQDADSDGDVDCFDCDDADATVGPTQPEVCDGLDNNCDGEVDEGFEGQDSDGDGATDCGEDCAPNDPTVFPGATEVCNAIDDDCDGDTDEGFDVDGDGVNECGPDGVVSADDDCDDGDATVFPGASEGCDGIDTDCDGSVGTDEVDDDGDGFIACDECDDADGSIHPAAAEACNEIDDDCDGVVPADEIDDADGDGTIECADCDDTDSTRAPTLTEVCDGADNDCDGFVPSDEIDGDGDGHFACDDCDDGDAAVSPSAPEVCDGVDNDCDGTTDTLDADGDGYDLCVDDCDDTDADIHPGATEECNGIDDDCDGLISGEDDLDFDGSLACADCDDGDGDVYPGANEACDGIDNDCDGAPGAGEIDTDGDGFLGCDECDDSDADVFPGGKEACDGVDTDCDGLIPFDENDLDGDGHRVCDGDCDDDDDTTWLGAPELCDGIDNNCDGSTDDENTDDDGDLVTPCAGDCDDTDAAINPDAEEICDGKDGDCDGVLPDDESDADEDGYFPCGGDCDDEDGSRSPAAPEDTEALCTDNVDNDCDGDRDSEEEDCAEWDDGSNNNGGRTTGCSCSSGGGGEAFLGLLLLVGALRRRR